MVARQNFILPEVIDPPRRCIQIQIPDEEGHILAFVGAIKQLTDWFNWRRDPDKKGTLVAKVWEDVFLSIDWSNMSCCPEVTTLTRVTSDGGLEISTDGGDTWIPDPSDPRTTAPSLPPLTPVEGVETRCQAAANALNQVEIIIPQIASLLDGVITIIALAAAILAIIGVLLLDPSGLLKLLPVILSELGYLDGVTESDYSATFTTDVYHRLNCILYCNMSDEGVISDSDYASIRSQIATEFSTEPIPKNTFLLIVAALGRIGMNIITTFPGGTPDCADCGCGCTVPFTIVNGTLLSSGIDGEGHCFVVVASAPHGGGMAEQVDVRFSASFPGVSTDCAKYLADEFMTTPVTVLHYHSPCPYDGTYPSGVTPDATISDFVCEADAGLTYTLKVTFTNA